MRLCSLAALALNGAWAFAPVPRPASSINNHHVPTTNASPPSSTQLHLDLFSMAKNFGKKVTVSHILIGPSTSVTGRGMIKEEATAKLLELKEEIGNDPEKFAAAAEEFSSCRASMTKGGDLGEFGPGLMVGAIDKICFEEEVGVVHGPVSTPYGEHLVLIRERTG